VIHVRPAKRGDAAAVARIHIAAWRAAYAGILPDNYLVCMSESGQARQWSRAIRRNDHLHRVFVAADLDETGDTVAGFASCGPARHAPGSLRSANDGEIFTLYVDLDRQGEGMGRALLEHCLETLARERRREAVVWVIAANPARFFYEAQGAKCFAERRESFAGRELVMKGYAWTLPVDVRAARETG
jgi:GNAT superfamily N-acetyltransferase